MCFLIAANHIVEDKKKVDEQVKTAYQKLTDSSELIQNTSSSEDSVRNAVWCSKSSVLQLLGQLSHTHHRLHPQGSKQKTPNRTECNIK